MSDFYFEESELSKKVESLNTSKSPGFDEIHPLVLRKGARSVIVKALFLLFRKFWEESVVSMDWKRLKITALHKSGQKREPNNYRPVSLTSICCKLMEKFVMAQIMKYLKRERLLHDKQYCFLPGRSTTLQLLKVLDEWTEAVDRGKEVDVIYLNFRKAFDSVPHIQLITILEQYEIRGKNIQ